MERLKIPPSGVYFTAFPKIFRNTCRIRKLSPITWEWIISMARIFKWWLRSAIWGFIISREVSIRLERLNSSLARVVLPLSIWLISNTSLISASRWRLDEEILPRQSKTRSLSSICAMAMVVIPMIPFIGVRISWDILERKFVLAALAWLALS